MTYIDEMRMYMIASSYLFEEAAPPITAEIEPPPVTDNTHLVDEVKDLIFRMKSYSEVDGSDEYRDGVEAGLQIAVGMLEHFVSQLENDLGP